MTWTILLLLIGAYITSIVWLRKKRAYLLTYVFSGFGFAFVTIHAVLLPGGQLTLAQIETHHLHVIWSWLGVDLQTLDNGTVLVPDSTGWSGLRIGVESSTLIELTILCGLILFYPRIPLNIRFMRLGIGITLIYCLNLVRLSIIIAMILIWGKNAVPVAHVLVGRLVYFAGVLTLYWYLLTKPTVSEVYNVIERAGKLSF